MSVLPLSPEQRAQKWGTVAKWAAFAVTGFLVSPFILATITGMLGLIVAVGIALTVWALSPSIETTAKNLRLKALKAAAAANPIETLQNEYLRRSTMLEDRKIAIDRTDANTRTFGDQLTQFKQQFPNDVPRLQADYDNMVTLVKRQRAQWSQAYKGLGQFQHEIDRAKALWSLAQSANAAKMGSGLGEDEFNAKLKTDTALETVQLGMNEAFSQLDGLIAESDAQETETTKATIVQTPQAALPAGSASIELDTSSVSTPSYAVASSSSSTRKPSKSYSR